MEKAFAHGFILALGLILPLGVQNVFVFNQGIYHRRWVNALPVVLMAGLCDTLLVLLAVFGVSLVLLKFMWLKLVITVVGVGFLIYMGWVTWSSKLESVNSTVDSVWPLRKQLVFAVSVSLLNPHAIADTVGIIGTSSLAYGDPHLRFAFTGAAIMVSWLWFLGLMTAGHLLGSLEQAGAWQKRINQASAIIMWFSGIILAKTLLGS